MTILEVAEIIHKKKKNEGIDIVAEELVERVKTIFFGTDGAPSKRLLDDIH